MKKSVLTLTVVVCLSMALTACGKEQQKDNIEVELLPGDGKTDETEEDTKNVGNEEGEVTDSEFQLIYNGLLEIIDKEVDSIIIYKLRMVELLNREVLGIEKSPIDEIL